MPQTLKNMTVKQVRSLAQQRAARGSGFEGTLLDDDVQDNPASWTDGVVIRLLLDQVLALEGQLKAIPKATRLAASAFPGVTRAKNIGGSSRTGALPESITVKEINALLGFSGKLDDGEGDGKVKYHWKFSYQGKTAAVWDYHGGRWSVWDPHNIVPVVFAALLHR